MRPFFRARPLTLGLLLLGAGCEAVTGLRSVTRDLAAFFVAPYPMSLSDSGVLLMAGELNESQSLSSRERLSVTIRTSRGDSETVGMWHSWCPDGDPNRDHCYAVTVVVFRDANRSEIQRKLNNLGMITTGADDGTLAWSVVGFNPQAIEKQAQTIARWDGVEGVIGVGVHYAENPAKSVAAPIRVSTGAPVIGDGRLQLQEGDVLTGIYVNPSGDTLRTTFTVPAMRLRSPP